MSETSGSKITWPILRDHMDDLGRFDHAPEVVGQFEGDTSWIGEGMTGSDVVAAVAARTRLDLAADREWAAADMLERGVAQDGMLNTPDEYMRKARVQRATGEQIMAATGIDRAVVDQVQSFFPSMRLAVEIDALENDLISTRLITPGHELTRQSLHGEL